MYSFGKKNAGIFFKAVREGDARATSALIAEDPDLVSVSEFIGHPLEASAVISHDPELASYNGGTALHAAAKAGHNELVNLLLAAGADVNSRSRWFSGQCYYTKTALIEASREGHITVVRTLLAAGAEDITCRA